MLSLTNAHIASKAGDAVYGLSKQQLATAAAQIRTVVERYPVDCPARAFLLLAVEECTPNSLVTFMYACIGLRKFDRTINDNFGRLLLGKENGEPVFERICAEIAAEGKYPQPTETIGSVRAFQRSRQLGLRRSVEGTLGIFFGAAVGMKAISMASSDDFSLTDFLLLLGTAATVGTATYIDYKNVERRHGFHEVLTHLNPTIEQAMGIRDVFPPEPVLGSAYGRG